MYDRYYLLIKILIMYKILICLLFLSCYSCKPNQSREPVDSAKLDGNGPIIESTTRSCSMQLINEWGGSITSAVLTRQSDADGGTNSIDAPLLENGDSSYVLQITFETGSAAAYDYWNVSFTDSLGAIWHTPNNDRCNISLSEVGTIVECTIYNDSNGPHLNVAVVNGCDFEITKT